MALFPSSRARRQAASGTPAVGLTAELLRTAHLELIPGPSLERSIEALSAGTTVSVTCSPVKGIAATLDASARLLDAGHRVVPHLAARMTESGDHVRQIAAWLHDHGVDEVFVIGGDAPTPHGPFECSNALVRALLDAGAPLTAVGGAGYPDGHASIPTNALDDALSERQALLEAAGVDGWISTQMCFATESIERWIGRQRDRGVSLPIHLGVPGAVDTAKLLSMGMRLGVGASLRYLRKNRATVSRLVAPGGFDPLPVIEPLTRRSDASGNPALGIDALHVFTFNQVAATEAWRTAALTN